MKNAIKYYYGIDIDEIRNIDDNYVFDKYYLIKYYKNINIELYNYLILNNKKTYKIIYNKDNEYVVNINNKPYVLLEMFDTNMFDLNDILNNNISIRINEKISWADMWSKKIDYYEKNIVNVKDKKIKKYFNYYVGLSENAISLFKTLNLDSEKTYLSHIRLNNKYDFYSPFNYIVDYKIRDIAEYIKYNNYEKYYSFINDYVSKASYNDALLLLIRFMYPSFYFDSLDQYFKQEKIDYSFSVNAKKYELFLKNIYNIIRKYYNTPIVDWLYKKK